MAAPGSDSLERLVPDEATAGDVTGQQTLQLHLERYQFAAQHVRPGLLLDMACGVGYGTHLLVESNRGIEKAIGVDLCAEAIDYARERYGHPRVEYIAADAMRFTWSEPFDTIVSLETVEHLPDPAGFIAHLRTLLKPGGVLISSVPTTPSVDANPHHLHDFTERSFRALFERHSMQEIARFRQVQPFGLQTVIFRDERRAKNLRRNLPVYYMTHPGSFVRRLYTTIRHGLTNHYITCVWQASR